MGNDEGILFHWDTQDSPRCVAVQSIEAFSNDTSETEVSEIDIKVKIKNEITSDCNKTQEDVTDITTNNANVKSEATNNSQVKSNIVAQSTKETSVIRKRHKSAYCPFSVALKCPICPTFIKGGMRNLLHLENHIISNHYQYRSRLPCLVREYMNMRKRCKCLLSKHGAEKYLNHW